MKRILLLTDLDRDLQTQGCLEQITTGLAGDYEFIEMRVAGDGLARAVGQFARLRKLSRSADLIHAWGNRALRIASLACEKPILFTPLPDDPVSSVGWLRSAMQRRTIHVMSLSGGEDRLLISKGVPPECCSLVRPGIRISRKLGRDDELRSRLGFAPDAKVVLLVGESRRHADHALGLLALTLLAEIDPTYRVLYMGKGEQAELVKSAHENWGAKVLTDAREVLDAEMRFEELVTAADAGLVCAADRLAILPILACMASGLPLVGPATRPVSEILEDHHTALLYSPRTARMAAQRILMLFEQPILSRKLSDQSRAEAYELFGVSRFLDEMRRIYA